MTPDHAFHEEGETLKPGDPPLAGIRVLELGHIVAGPAVGQALADLGADVVKVEPPQGDGLRNWPPIVQDGDDKFSLNFAVINRNKRSVVLDLKTVGGQDRVLQLCSHADVVVENFRPEALAQLGLDVDDITTRAPHLVWCSVSGFGQSGPYAARGAYDVVIQGYSGMMSVTGEEDGPPAKCGVPVGDFIAGLYGALTISAALRRREVTGQGAVLDCSMLASLLSVSSLQVSQYLGTGIEPQRMGSAHPRNAPYQAYECSDGYITIAAGNESLWRHFCEAIGLPELIHDPRFIDQDNRVQNQGTLAEVVAAVLREQRREYWLKKLTDQGVPCGPVNTVGEALEDAQVRHLDLVPELRLPNGSQTRGVSFPVATPSWDVKMSAPPALGQHTEEVLREWID